MAARSVPEYTDMLLQAELGRTAKRDVTDLDLDGRQAAGEYRAELLAENQRRINRRARRSARSAMLMAGYLS